MSSFTISQILIVITLILCYVAVTGLGAYKIVRCHISDYSKTVLVILLAFLHVVAAIPFILYHDYIMPPGQRA
ncbi:MAG: hypothetical protein U0X39_05700 [Bacteroidales bacterium]